MNSIVVDNVNFSSEYLKILSIYQIKLCRCDIPGFAFRIRLFLSEGRDLTDDDVVALVGRVSS